MQRLLALILSLLCVEASGVELRPAPVGEVSPREDIRKKIFSDSLMKRDCKIISKNPSGSVAENPGITAALQKLIEGINQKSTMDLLSLFHPQLKVKKQQIAAALTSIERIAGADVQASLFRAYAINNPDGDPQPTTCAEDGILIRPLYGHRIQVAVWIQAQGRDEVARVFANFVPTKDKWQIGAWHVQQWTHTGQDYNEWREKAQKAVEKKQTIPGWIFYDIAIKLLDGGKFLSFPFESDFRAEQSRILASKTLLQALKPKFPQDNLVYASSLFSRKGAALLIRFSLETEWSANAIREHCKVKYRQFLNEGIAKDLSGVRCDYVLTKESPNKEGVMGGIFIDESSLKTK
jgi:hypothetical protein